MNARTSSALVFALDNEGINGFNFLQKTAFQGDAELVEFLRQNLDPLPISEGGSEELGDFVKLGAVVDQQSEQAAVEAEFREKWAWGLPAAAYHFSVQGNPYLSLEDGETKQRENAAAKGLPQLYLDNARLHSVVALPAVDRNRQLMKSMASRRSDREPTDNPMPLASVAEVLFSSMGITGFTRNAVTELPLSMTPSGGARNPYEAFVIARNVNGLVPGIYHYSAIDHSLGCLSGGMDTPLSAFVGGQDWADAMACVIVLAAFFERTSWKYDDPNAYRVVLIEAGHIGQNMLLMAADEGLAACPTAALSHDFLFECLDLPSRITCAPIYAVALGSKHVD
jgi:SagB-type dehydrogenase family enzyme